MASNKQLIYCFFLVLCFGLWACDDYDSFTTSPSARLTMQQDTINFDTVITTVATPTRSLVVRNRGDKGLRIASVALRGGASSPFRVNVDGEPMSGGIVRDLMVRGGDSIFVRVEVTLPEWGHNNVATLEDGLVFTLESGVQQEVALIVSGRDGIFLRNETFEADTVLTSTRPYIIYGTLTVAPDVRLTLLPGTTLMFHTDASLLVDGTLVAQGLPDSMVVMRGDRTDRMFTNLYYDNTPMRWQGVHLTPRSHDNVLTCTDLHSATWGLLADTTDVRLDSCVIHNIAGNGLTLTASQCKAYNIQLSNTLGHCLSLTGGSTLMEYCTLAQFYPWDARRAEALYLSNRDEEGYTVPFEKAHFLNCLITGYAEDVVTGNVDDPDETLNYLFSACFLKTVKPDEDPRYPDTELQDIEDDITERFVLFDTTNFLYDFHFQGDTIVNYGIR